MLEQRNIGRGSDFMAASKRSFGAEGTGHYCPQHCGRFDENSAVAVEEETEFVVRAADAAVGIVGHSIT